MKLTVDRPYSDPEAAARKLVEIANSVEAVQDGRIYIELVKRQWSWPDRKNKTMFYEPRLGFDKRSTP
jgi:hypothetical protein